MVNAVAWVRYIFSHRRRKPEAPVALQTVLIGLNAGEWPRFTRGWERRTRCALISGQEPVHLPPDEAGKGPKPRTVQPRGENLDSPEVSGLTAAPAESRGLCCHF